MVLLCLVELQFFRGGRGVGWHRGVRSGPSPSGGQRLWFMASSPVSWLEGAGEYVVSSARYMHREDTRWEWAKLGEASWRMEVPGCKVRLGAVSKGHQLLDAPLPPANLLQLHKFAFK